MSRPAFEFCDLLSQSGQVAPFIQKSGAKQNDVLDRTGDALAEPQCACVVFTSVVDRFEALRTNSLHVPEMEKLVSSDIDERLGIVAEVLSVEFNRGGIRVLHAATTRTMGEMREKEIFLKRAVVHPTGCGGHDAVSIGCELWHVIVRTVRVHNHAVMPAAFVEIGFLKRTNFYG